MCELSDAKEREQLNRALHKARGLCRHGWEFQRYEHLFEYKCPRCGEIISCSGVNRPPRSGPDYCSSFDLLIDEVLPTLDVLSQHSVMDQLTHLPMPPGVFYPNEQGAWLFHISPLALARCIVAAIGGKDVQPK